MATTVTSRVSGTITANTTKQISGVDAAIYRAWGNSWGDSWGDSWLVYLGLSAIGHTPRVGSAPTANNTKRVTLA